MALLHESGRTDTITAVSLDAASVKIFIHIAHDLAKFTIPTRETILVQVQDVITINVMYGQVHHATLQHVVQMVNLIQ